MMLTSCISTSYYQVYKTAPSDKLVIKENFYIYEDELRPVYPANYSIINRQGIKLQASTANPIASLRNYN